MKYVVKQRRNGIHYYLSDESWDDCYEESLKDAGQFSILAAAALCERLEEENLAEYYIAPVVSK